MIWLYVSNPESGGISPGPIILSNTTMPGAPAELHLSLALHAPEYMLVTYLGGLDLCGMTLSSGNISYTLEAGAHD